MTRFQKQKKLAAAARTLATKIQQKKVTPLGALAVIQDGKPANLVGQVLKQAGVKLTPKQDTLEEEKALAYALATTPDTLPEDVVAAAASLYFTVSGGAKRATVAKELNAFAETLVAKKIRKTYTRSGKFTTAAREAGTFGRTAPTAPIGSTI
jgi:hypothetical protein